MRSKFLVSAAIAAVGVSGLFVSVAQAAHPKEAKRAAAKQAAAKQTAAKPIELHADDKSMKRQTQWEEKVMGPDSQRAELDKIARARAMNAEAEKEKERQAALEPEPAPKAAPAKKNEKRELSLLSTPVDETGNRPHEISPKLATEAAKTPPAPVKPADDKFIDKLLRDEDAPTKRRASSANDRELENLLAGAKEKPAGRKRSDSVDALLRTADKGPAMPAPRAQSSGLPEWARQPEIAPTPAAPPPSPVALRTQPRNTGVIQVIQGAAGNAPAVLAPARPATVASRSSRKASARAAAQPAAVWNDPFADRRPAAPTMKKQAASRPAATPETTWNDPFANEPSETRKPVRHTTTSTTTVPAAPASRHNDKAEPSARPGGGAAAWKDPFTKASPEPAHTSVAMRELRKSESAKWEVAARRPAPARPASDTHAASGWSILKKRGR